MKKYVFLAAGVMLTASSAALAQNHGAGTQSNVTVGGIFVPAVSGRGVMFGGGVGGSGNVTVTTPPTTPVTVNATGALASVVSGGGATAVASLTVALQGSDGGRRGTTSVISPASATALANALALLSSGGTPTVQSVVNAVTAWNLAVAAMTPADVRGAFNNSAFSSAQRALQGAVRTIAPYR